MNLVLLKDEDFIDTNRVRLLSKDYRYQHIKRILKLTLGDTFKAGLLNTSQGVITILLLTDASLEGIYEITTVNHQPYPIHLVLGATRPIVMKRLIKDISSIGISSLTAFTSENSEKSYLASNFWHNHEMEQSIIDGLSQGFHIHAPRIQLANNLHEALQIQPVMSSKFVLDPYAYNKWPRDFSLGLTENLVLLIGSERGFTQKELHLAQTLNYQPISLTNNILRTETATIATLSLAIHTYESHVFHDKEI